MDFTMEPEKEGRLKYLILAIGPGLGVLYLGRHLMLTGYLPMSELLAFFVSCLSLVLMAVPGYFLILRKNHVIEVSDLSIAERDWRGNVRLIAIRKIHSFRRNLLGELLLLDENGKTLLCAESNLSNRASLEKWLERHQITENK